MLIASLLSRELWTGPEGTWWYDDAFTWITAAVVLAWVTWFVVNRYFRGKALRRPKRGANSRLLKRTARIKRELSSRYLRPGFSGNIHAVGIGRLGPGIGLCIQVFINDPNQELWVGSGAAALPDNYRGVPLLLIQMPSAGFLSDEVPDETWKKYSEGIREPQDVIVGGISGANTNLTGESGTIGYFCTRKRRLARRREIYLLSNSHVFADLHKGTVDESDLIMQPSPGERASNRPIGTLVNFSALNFAGDLSAPNHIDAAIAKLWGPQPHQPLIPLIGAVKGYVETTDVEIGEPVRKFGRTTGYTEGQLFSIHLDIRIRYDRTGQSAFFQDQFLIEPAPQFARFVSGGDSGSLLVDANQHAIGLIFAGTTKLPESVNTPGIDPPKRLEGYGVANPIREVLDGLKIELLI